MPRIDSYKLHFGPYRTPRFKYGAKVECEARGEVRIVKLTDARIIPSEDALRLVLEEVFWSSMDQYEGQFVRARVYFAPEPALSGYGIIRLSSSLPLSKETIRRLSPAHGPDGALLVVEDSSGQLGIAAILGSSPFTRGGAPWWLCVESRGPGVIRVRIGADPILDFIRGSLRALGEAAFDESVATFVLTRVLETARPTLESIYVSSLVLQIGRAIEDSGTGGALWILPTDPSAGADLFGLGYQVNQTDDWCELFREEWENRTAMNLATKDAPAFWQAAQEWDHLRQDAVARSVASLARIDGAILMTGAPRVAPFGVICNDFSRPAGRVLRLATPSDLSSGDDVDASKFGGSRHRSAINFCSSHSPACAVVASHDGGITVFRSLEAGHVAGVRVSQIQWNPAVLGE
jgi:hypothetical protein